MMKKVKSFLLFLTFFILITYFSFGQKELVTDDEIYENNIKTVLLYPTANVQDTSTVDMRSPPIVPINQNPPLRLEFDEIGSDFQNYFIKIVNCNADWSISQLNAIQYLNDYNEFQISERKLSFNTRVPYVHYGIFLPRVKISGNYLVVVYKGGDDKDIILSKRFLVYESPLIINMEPKFPVVVRDRNTGQQIDFTINFSQYNLINPLQNLKVLIRQNYRWDNSIINLKPSFINETSHSLEYYFFNGESTFKGLNEFRFFDIRSNRFKGQHVSKVTFDADKTDVILMDDYNRNGQPFSQYFDFTNGRYIIQNYESGDNEIQPDYVNANFVFDSPKIDEKVYIVGGFNNFKINPTYEMKYNTAINKYVCTVLLKQGIYNYLYCTNNNKTPNMNLEILEGSFNQTQNIYDIIVYYRPMGAISDQIIGYSITNYQGR